jgi:uncharacterized protein
MAELAGVAPMTEGGREVSLDIVRGVALFGILLMNITGFGLPYAYSDPTVYGGSEGLNLVAWLTTTVLFEGTQRGMFSLLFGAGVIVLTSRLEASGRPDASDVYFRRNLWLIVFGLVHGFLLLWDGEILFYYGVTALFVYGFRKAAPRTLIAIAIAGLAFNGAWNLLDSYNGLRMHAEWQEATAVENAGAELSAEQSGAIEAWEEILEDRKPSAEKIDKAIAAHRGGYFEQMAFQAPELAHWQAWGLYRYFFDIFSMMLIGMALYKLGLLSLGHSPGVYWRMVAIGYAIGLTVNGLEARWLLANEFSVLSRMQAGVSYDLGRLGMTTGHLGLLMLICNSSWLPGLQRRLAAVGQMALTNYVSHSIICVMVFSGVGFGLYGQLERYQLYYVVFAIWAFQLMVSPIWLRSFRFGPLEWLWRSLTYNRRQPMRRRSSPPTPPRTAETAPISG